MINRINRFHGHRSVSRVRGKTKQSTNFTLRFAANKKDDFRAAVVVSKKVDKRAVVRNRIRRRIYEVLRTECDLQGRQLDLVVYVKNAAAADMKSAELTKEILSTVRSIFSTPK